MINQNQIQWQDISLLAVYMHGRAINVLISWTGYLLNKRKKCSQENKKVFTGIFYQFHNVHFCPSGKRIMAVVLTSSVIQTRVLGTSGRPYWVEMRGMEPVQTRVPYLVHVYPALWPSIQQPGECHPHSPKVIPQTKYQVFGKEVHCFTRMLLGTFGQYQTKCIYFFIFGEFFFFLVK